ncbi:sugar MFS transporter [Psychromonas aquimarina]|uniref:sugar MFS transporter n=1 Tax=Psychromonas aquimarina TaxID=444919 RepID=UPI00041443D0|nr:sugar MFS transporter [Psychromonas aquimarina]
MPLSKSQPQNRTTAALTLLSSVFFIWGFLTSLNSVLIPHLQQVFQLSYSESMLIQAVFSSSPLLISLPAVKLMHSIGYKNTLLFGLALTAAGALAFYPAADAFSYPLVLLAVLITAMGVAVLQVVANPYAAALGDRSTAASRLTMASGINSLGTTIAPYIGALLLFSAADLSAQDKAELVQGPYLLTAAVITVLIIIMKISFMPEPRQVSVKQKQKTFPAWRYRHLLLGMLTIFCYTGAEVSIGSFLLSYLNQQGDYSTQTGAKLVALYWAGAMTGRLLGPFVFRYICARKVLFINALTAAALILSAVVSPGISGGWALIAVGLCNSIMYPVIFSIALDKLGESTAQASGMLVMAGVGGAVLPLMQALLADSSSLVISLIIPAMCYAVIMAYSLFGWRPCLLGAGQRLQVE